MEDNGAIPAVGLWAGRVIVEAGGGSFPNPPTLAMMDAKGVLLGLVLGSKLDFPGSVASGEEEAGSTGSVGGVMEEAGVIATLVVVCGSGIGVEFGGSGITLEAGGLGIAVEVGTTGTRVDVIVGPGIAEEAVDCG
jgi:hypothetical protein